MGVRVQKSVWVYECMGVYMYGYECSVCGSLTFTALINWCMGVGMRIHGGMGVKV